MTAMAVSVSNMAVRRSGGVAMPSALSRCWRRPTGLGGAVAAMKGGGAAGGAAAVAVRRRSSAPGRRSTGPGAGAPSAPRASRRPGCPPPPGARRCRRARAARQRRRPGSRRAALRRRAGSSRLRQGGPSRRRRANPSRGRRGDPSWWSPSPWRAGRPDQCGAPGPAWFDLRGPAGAGQRPPGRPIGRVRCPIGQRGPDVIRRPAPGSGGAPWWPGSSLRRAGRRPQAPTRSGTRRRGA